MTLEINDKKKLFEKEFLNNLDLVKKIVDYYFSSYSREEKEDIKQNIIEKIYTKLDRIAELYKEKCSAKTYLSQIIKNYCINEHVERRTKKIAFVSYDLDASKYDNQASAEEKINIILPFETTLLENVLSKMPQKDRAKLIIMLKLLRRKKIKPQEFQDLSSLLKIEDYKDLLDPLDPKLSQVQIFNKIVPVINTAENKLNGADNLRKWTESRIKQIGELYQNTFRNPFDKQISRDHLYNLFDTLFERLDMDG